MPGSTIQSVMRAVSRAAYHGGLKAAGFRRQGNHFHRQSRDLIHAFQFQASTGMAVRVGAFTVNLVVTAESLYRHWSGRALPKNPATALFPINERIGLLMPQQEDHWWRADADVESLCLEVSHALVTWGLPFFDQFASLDVLLDRLRTGASVRGMPSGHVKLVHAMLASDKGHASEAEQQICQALEEAGASSYRETVQRVASRLGVTLP